MSHITINKDTKIGEEEIELAATLFYHPANGLKQEEMNKTLFDLNDAELAIDSIDKNGKEEYKVVPSKTADKILLGIDIGANGGFFILGSNGEFIETFKMPETRRLLQEKLIKYMDYNCFALVEKIHCRPTNGSKSNFTLGEYKERMLYTLELFKIPYEEVTPQSWMKKYFLKREKTETSTQWKNRLKEKALQLFPKQKITLWNSDAALIAYRALRDY